MTFQRKILMTLFTLTMGAQWPMIQAREAGTSMTYVKVGMTSRSVETNMKNSKDKTSVDPMGYLIKAKYSFHFTETQSFGIGASYYMVGESDVEKTGSANQAEETKDKTKYERSEFSILVNYKGSHEFSEALKLHYGAYSAAWRFKPNEESADSVLYNSVLNHSKYQSSTVELTPYIGISMKVNESGMVTLKGAWNHHFFQNSAVELTPEEANRLKEKPVEIEGGHSMTAKLKYSHMMGPVKIAAWGAYTQTMVPRSAEFKTKEEDGTSSGGKSYEDIKGMKLNMGGKIAYDINEMTKIKIWGAYDILGEIEYTIKETKSSKDETNYEGTDQSFVGGLSLAVAF